MSSLHSLHVDIAPAKYRATADPCVLHARARGAELVGIVDGRGTWGNGHQAAEWTRGELERRWALAFPASIEDAAKATVEMANDAHERFDDADFGCSFCAILALIDAERLYVAAAGTFEAWLFSEAGARQLFRTALLVDEVIASGKLSSEEIAQFPHPNVCIGPFLADGRGRPMTVVEPVTRSGGETVVLGHRYLFDDLPSPLPPSALAWQARDDVGSPVIVVPSREPARGGGWAL